MIHGMNQYRGVVMMSVILQFHIKTMDENIAHIIIVG